MNTSCKTFAAALLAVGLGLSLSSVSGCLAAPASPTPTGANSASKDNAAGAGSAAVSGSATSSKSPAVSGSATSTKSPAGSGSATASKSNPSAGSAVGSGSAAAATKTIQTKPETTKTAVTVPPPKTSTTKTPIKPNSKLPAKTAASAINKSQTKITRPPGKAPATVTADGKPIWLDVNTAKRASALKNKPILADFYTDWCQWCKVMDRTTFMDPKIQAHLASKYVCMKVDAQDGAEGQQLAQRYQVVGFPTAMVFKPSGKPIAIAEGYRDAKAFMQFLEHVAKLPTR